MTDAEAEQASSEHSEYEEDPVARSSNASPLKDSSEAPEDGESVPHVPVKRGRGRPRKYPIGTNPTPKLVKKKRVSEAPEPDLEAEIEEDEKDPLGEEKIDINGVLQGGRQYIIRSMILPRHPERVYMLTTDVAKVFGFRDSYIYFQKNPDEPRIYATNEDKDVLASNLWIPGQFKSRSVLLLPARHVFRRFGYKVILNGVPVRDDYFVGDRKEGDVPLEEFDNSRLFDFNMTIQQKVPVKEFVPLTAEQRRKLMINALVSASDYNSRVHATREEYFYDVHLNQEMVTQKELVVKVEMDPTMTDEFSIDDQVNLSSSNWINAVATTDQYPIEILPGQYHMSRSIYPTRFSAEDAKKAHEIIIKKAQERRKKEPEPPTEEPTAEPEEQQVKLSDLTAFICGEITKNGNECRRPVVRDGDKCSHHEPFKMGECIVCKEVQVAESFDDKPAIPPTLMISCANCRTRHHPSCIEMDDVVLINKCLKYEWHCSNCKMCSVCEEAGDESKLLFCDDCDRGYHTYCLKPALNELPEGQWLCRECANCRSCGKTSLSGSRRSKQQAEWKHAIEPSNKDNVLDYYICTYCPDCFKKYSKNLYCPCCFKTYAEDNEELEMVCCDQCDRWVHVVCEPELSKETYEKMSDDPELKFTCTLCDDRKLVNAINKRRLAEDFQFKIITSASGRLVVPPLTEPPTGLE